MIFTLSRVLIYNEVMSWNEEIKLALLFEISCAISPVLLLRWALLYITKEYLLFEITEAPLKAGRTRMRNHCNELRYKNELQSWVLFNFNLSSGPNFDEHLIMWFMQVSQENSHDSNVHTSRRTFFC